MTEPSFTPTALFAELSEDSLRCRVNGHQWQPVNARKVVAAFETVEHCQRCHAERESVISNKGAIRSRTIRYPEHYLRKGQGLMETGERNAMRLTVLTWDFGVST